MRVTGARLLARDAAIRLGANWDQALPAHHEPFVVPLVPGSAIERRLVVEVADAVPGARLAVHVYPVQSGGTASIVVEAAGRCRVTAALTPSFEGLGKVWIDVEDADGEELWADEVPVQSPASTVIAQLATRFPEASVHGCTLCFDGPHEMQAHVAPDFIAVTFRCEVGTRIVGRVDSPARLLDRLPWQGHLLWAAADTARAEREVPVTFRSTLAILPMRRGTEATLSPDGCGMTARFEGGQVDEREAFIRTALAAVTCLPPPVSPRLPDPPHAPTPACEPVWARARLLAMTSAQMLSPFEPLTGRHDPILAPRIPGDARPRFLIAEIRELVISGPAFLRVTSLDSHQSFDVHGTSYHEQWGSGPLGPRWVARVDVRVTSPCLVRLDLRVGHLIVWSELVPCGPMIPLLTKELADRMPGAVRASGSNEVRFEQDIRIELSQAPEPYVGSTSRVVPLDPLQRFGKRLFGERFVRLVEPASYDAIRLEAFFPCCSPTAVFCEAGPGWPDRPFSRLGTDEPADVPETVRTALAELARLHVTSCRLGSRLGRASVLVESPDFPEVERAVGLVRKLAREAACWVR